MRGEGADGGNCIEEIQSYDSELLTMRLHRISRKETEGMDIERVPENGSEYSSGVLQKLKCTECAGKMIKGNLGIG